MSENEQCNDDTDQPQGLTSPEKCTHCGDWIDTSVGTDSYTKVTDYTTTDLSHEVFCNRLCLFQSLQAGTDRTEGDDE